MRVFPLPRFRRRRAHPLLLHSMLSILSTMLSFVISLRTSSALERWNAGRMAWTQLSTGSRNLASLIWIHVGPYTLSLKDQSGLVPGSPEEEVEKVKALIEKRTM